MARDFELPCSMRYARDMGLDHETDRRGLRTVFGTPPFAMLYNPLTQMTSYHD